MKNGRWWISDLVSNTREIKSWETFWNTHWWILCNLNISQCSWSIFTEIFYVKLVGNMPKSEWIYTNKVQRMEIRFLGEQRYQSRIVQLVRDEFQSKEREFYQLLQIMVLIWMLYNFDFILFSKEATFSDESFKLFGWVSNSECLRRIKKCEVSTEGQKKKFSSKFHKWSLWYHNIRFNKLPWP